MKMPWYSIKTPWYYGWNIIAFCTLFQAITFGSAFYSFAIMAIPLTETFNVSLSQVMLATVALQIGIGALSPPLGKALDMVRLRNLVALGALALCLGFVIMANTRSLWIMMLVYGSLLPVGLILAGSIAAQTAAARWFVRRRGFALGISAVGTSIGAFLFPPIVEHLLSNFGISQTFIVLALLCALVIIPMAWLVLHRDPTEADLQRESQGKDQQATPAPPEEKREWNTAKILRYHPFWMIICGFAPVTASFNAIQFNLGAYARDHGLEPSQTAYLLSIAAAAMFTGKFFFASLADRLDHRLLFWIIAIGQGAALVLLQFSPTYAALVAIILIFGFSMGGALPMVAAMIADQFGVKAFGQVVGICMMFITASSAAGPYFAALIYDISGTFNTAFSLIAGLLLCGSLAVLTMKPHRVATQG